MWSWWPWWKLSSDEITKIFKIITIFITEIIIFIIKINSVIRAKTSFLAAGKKDHLARLGEGRGGRGGLSLTGQRPFKMNLFSLDDVRDVRGGAFSSGAGRGWKSAGRVEYKNPRGGAKKHVNQLIQNFDKSAWIVTGGFVLQYGVLIKENITFSDFKWSFCKPDNHKLYKRPNEKLFLHFPTLSPNLCNLCNL